MSHLCVINFSKLEDNHGFAIKSSDVEIATPNNVCKRNIIASALWKWCWCGACTKMASFDLTSLTHYCVYCRHVWST